MGAEIVYLEHNGHFYQVVNDRDFMEVGITTRDVAVMKSGSSYNSVRALREGATAACKADFDDMYAKVAARMVMSRPFGLRAE